MLNLQLNFQQVTRVSSLSLDISCILNITIFLRVIFKPTTNLCAQKCLCYTGPTKLSQNPSRQETFCRSPAAVTTLQSCIPASRAVLRTPEVWGGDKRDSLHEFLGSRSISETFPRRGSVTPSPHWVRISGRSSCVHHVELQQVFH